MSKYLTEKEAVEEVLGLITPSNLSPEDYNTFKSYRQRWRKGTLGDKAIFKLLNHFGYDKRYIKRQRPK